MRCNVSTLSTIIALALGGLPIGCESDDSSTGGAITPSGPSVAIDGGTGTDAGAIPSQPNPPGEAANTILGLTSKGNIVRIGLGPNGTEEDLGFPKFNGTELRNIGAIASGGGGLYGIDYGAKSGSNVVKMTLPGLDCSPMGAEIDFRAQEPGKPGLAFSGTHLYGTDQFGPLIELGLDGSMKMFTVRLANSVADDTQCTSPEDLLWEGGLLAAGSCASETQPDKNGFFVWEYLFGLPGTSGQGGTSTDKSMRYRSPERIVGLGKAAGGLVATSAQRNLLALSGTNFVVVRELQNTIVDLE